MDILKDTNRIFVAKDNDIVIKKYKCLSDSRNKHLLGKLERIDELKKIKGLVVPEGYEVENGIVKNIYTKYIDYEDLLYNSCKNELSFETISRCLMNLEKTLKELHNNKIYALDFISNGNLKYNKDTNDIYLLDYEDMQVEDNLAFACNVSLRDFIYMKISKYYDSKKFTYNADIYLLAIFWFKLCTHLELPNISRNPIEMFETVDLPLDEEIAKNILLCYDLNIDNSYFDESFMELNRRFNLDFNEDMYFRKFIKK